jgi:hypothetical protein
MSNYTSDAFNARCYAAGVQCTITSDPADFKRIYDFKNLGTAPVQVTWGKITATIPVGESFPMKILDNKDPLPSAWFVSYNRVTR